MAGPSSDRCAVPTVSAAWPVAILTVSDRCSQGLAEDTSGAWLAERLAGLPGEVVARACVADEPDEVEGWLRTTLDALPVALVVCTGGTGLHPRDRTPDAVRRVADYEVPGFGEAMRSLGVRHTPHAILSRQIAVVRRRSLIMALPGARQAVEESLEAVWAALPHALEMVAGLPGASLPDAHGRGRPTLG
ncbi:MAG TPA: MogA/MoaB family molybdenum cofactor biosynthesis protein [Verrucomicrobiae bacterium]|nr:MogA/MoaB family molybdenum cofactor biosynthesis protein [Verrucomicrobiae bacterium]